MATQVHTVIAAHAPGAVVAVAIDDIVVGEDAAALQVDTTSPGTTA
ncbi:hypothetical protein [Klenkia sp. PcliD-1-E]|nr:hypothetical protein [Klenkia sp. PcliD-1-E]MCO7218356.1 hypothetical protein [Klenkia sp. PcliD-1-E]